MAVYVMVVVVEMVTVTVLEACLMSCKNKAPLQQLQVQKLQKLQVPKAVAYAMQQMGGQVAICS